MFCIFINDTKHVIFRGKCSRVNAATPMISFPMKSSCARRRIYFAGNALKRESVDFLSYFYWYWLELEETIRRVYFIHTSFSQLLFLFFISRNLPQNGLKNYRNTELRIGNGLTTFPCPLMGGCSQGGIIRLESLKVNSS